MRDLEGLTLFEMPWFSTDFKIPTVPTSVYPGNGNWGRLVRVDRLDIRIEDLKRYGGAAVRDIYNWLAPVPWMGAGLYLTHDHGIIDQGRAGQLGWPVLPTDWWEYATGNVGDRVVKAPKYPRGGEASQEDLDAHPLPRGTHPNAGGDVAEGRRSRRRGNAAMAPLLPAAVTPAGDDSPRASRASIPCESYRGGSYKGKSYRDRLREVLSRPF